jgi:hypothetical protein
VNIKAPKEATKGQGLGSTKWYGEKIFKLFFNNKVCVTLLLVFFLFRLKKHKIDLNITVI